MVYIKVIDLIFLFWNITTYVFITMAFKNQIQISSFNCTGIKSSREYISTNICINSDIIAMQEMWILPHEVDVCQSIHRDFTGFAKSSVDVEKGPLRGRPYGGLGFLWRSSLDAHVTPVAYEEDRLMGLKVQTDSQALLIINVYMPTHSYQNLDEFMSILGAILSSIQTSECDAFCVVGDFNADLNTIFYRELKKFCDTANMVISDVNALPGDSYTFYSDAHGTTSWLDHICVSENIAQHVNSHRILYGGGTSGHFPLCVTLNLLSTLEEQGSVPSNERSVKWKFNDNEKVNEFKNKLSIELMKNRSSFCFDNNCQRQECKGAIDRYFDSIRDSILSVGSEVFQTKSHKSFVATPGWNEHVREHNERARSDFLLWRSLGSPREGEAAARMRASRAQFKLALRECRASESRMRAEALAQKLAAKDITGLCPVIAVRDGGVRLHSRLWHRWSLVLRGDGRQELLGG